MEVLMLRVVPLLIVVGGLLLAGCASTTDPAPPPGLPNLPGGEAEGTRGPVYVDSTELLLLESYPVQVRLKVSGSLPTPCHALKWEIREPSAKGRIDVALFSLADPNLACIQVLEPFDASIPLGAFESGSYNVYLNGEPVGDLEI
jgi:hypothetical protein